MKEIDDKEMAMVLIAALCSMALFLVADPMQVVTHAVTALGGLAVGKRM